MDFSALVGALGAVGGGMLTANSIGAQTAMADRQFNANLAFQKGQYEDMKRWQSPANQVRLLREAGLNPALALDSKLSGNALSSVGGVSPTAAAASGNFNDLPSVAANLITSLTQNELFESEQAKNYAAASSSLQDTIGKQIDNAYKHGNNKLAQYLTKMEGLLTESEASFNLQSMDKRVEGEQYKTAILMAEMESQGISSKWLDQTKSAEYENILASTAALYATKRLNLNQASEVVARKIASFGLDQYDAEDLYDASMDMLESQIDANYASSFNNYSGDWKKNPSVMGVGNYRIGELHNRSRMQNKRANLRRAMRQERRRQRK